MGNIKKKKLLEMVARNAVIVVNLEEKLQALSNVVHNQNKHIDSIKDMLNMEIDARMNEKIAKEFGKQSLPVFKQKTKRRKA